MSVSSTVAASVLPSGSPCWVELGVSDDEAAARFYSRLFGWEYDVQPDPATGRYSIASVDGVASSGLYPTTRDQPEGWTLQLAVQNIANTANWITHLGGLITLGPVEIPHRGSILHAIDPSGAPAVFWEPTINWEFGTGTTGTFAGADLNTHDGGAADRFFCRLFNLADQQIGMGDIDYAQWRLEQDPVLYRYVMGPEYHPDTPPHWMVYFSVDPSRGTDGIAGQARALGGSVLAEPYDTAFGRIAMLADPCGAPFSIIDQTRAVEEWARAEVDDPYDD